MDIFNKIFDWIGSKLEWILSAVLALLPTSPFSFVSANAEFSTWFGMLNWFIPVSTFVSILEAWATAVVVWYVYQTFLRWAKVTQ